ADAVVFLLENVSAADVPDGLINVGVGGDLTIEQLAGLVQRVVAHRGPVHWDRSKPDGTPRKLLDVSRMTTLGWHPATELEDGLSRTYAWYLENALGSARGPAGLTGKEHQEGGP
ncbi:MAG TPA: hypothetical protein VJ787_12095, partial [Thermoleophilia bacterium]|nr:hypothetical protein [Thermoleophilia bacterium]